MCESPTRSNSRSCSTRSSFICSAALIVPDFVEEERAFVRLLEASLAVADGAGERAAHVAEELGFEQRFGNRAAVERDEPVRAPRAVVVNRPRDTTSLPVPVSPVMRMVLLVGATVSSSWNSRFIGRLLPMMPFEAVALFELRAQVRVLRFQPPLLERRVEHVQQFVDLERLVDEVRRAALDGLDRVLHRAVAGDDDRDDVADSVRPRLRRPRSRRCRAGGGR